MKLSRFLVVPALLALAACQQASPNANDGASQDALEKAAAPGRAALKAGFDNSHRGEQPPAVPLETGPDGATDTIASIVAANPGKKILVNLWATWCVPCIKELPTLDALAATSSGQLVIVPVSQDMEGWQKVTPAFTAEKYPHLSTRLESKMEFGRELGAVALPMTILYGADGREQWRYLGDRDWTSAESKEKIDLS